MYLLLLIQCALLSWYLPALLHKRMRRVITEYPPSDFPLLYPKEEHEYHAFHAKFLLMNRVAFVAGIVVVVGLMLLGVNVMQEHWMMLPWGMFMVQMVPIMIVEASEFNHLKALREQNKSSIRVAGMQSRGLKELVAPSLFIGWIASFVGAILVVAWTDNFEFAFLGDAYSTVLIVVIMNILGYLYLRWLLSGKRLDPYQDPEDKLRYSKAVTKSLMFLSIAVSVFMAVTRVLDVTEAQYLQPVLMTFYCQIIAYGSITTTLRGVKLEDINFDVYRQSHKV